MLAFFIGPAKGKVAPTIFNPLETNMANPIAENFPTPNQAQRAAPCPPCLPIDAPRRIGKRSKCLLGARGFKNVRPVLLIGKGTGVSA